MFSRNIRNNIVENILDPEDAIGLEDKAEDQNTLYSNKIVNSNNQQQISISNRSHPGGFVKLET